MKQKEFIRTSKIIRYTILLAVCSLMIGVAAISISKVSAEFVNYFISFEKGDEILFYTLSFGVAICAFGLLKHLFYKITISINSDLKMKVYGSIVDSGIDERNQLEDGKAVTLLEQDTDSITRFLEDRLPELVEAVVVAFLMGTVTFVINKIMFIVIMLLSLISGISVILYKRITNIETQYLEKIDTLNGKFFDLIKAIPILNSLNNIDILIRKIKNIVDKSCELDFKNKIIIVLFEALTHLCSVARELFVIFYGIYFVRMDVGTIVATLNITSFYGEFVKSTGELLIHFAKIKTSVNRIESIVFQRKEEIDYELYDLPVIEMEIRNLTYIYIDGTGLKNCSLKLVRDKINLIKGEVGTGKSTFGKIISGLLSQQSGKIIVNKHEMGLKQLRAMVAYVDQDTIISFGTIEQNISAFAEDVSNKKIVDCINRAGLREWVDTLPEGIKTELDAENLNLSGGQKQRIAIARALYKDSPIIVLDEPTSSLDNSNVRRLCDQINNLCKNKIMVIITHDVRLVEGFGKTCNLTVFK